MRLSHARNFFYPAHTSSFVSSGSIVHPPVRTLRITVTGRSRTVERHAAVQAKHGTVPRDQRGSAQEKRARQQQRVNEPS